MRTADGRKQEQDAGANRKKNQGSEPTIRLQRSGKNRGLLYFDRAALQSALSAGTLSAATLELTIDVASNNWGASGRPIAVHRMLQTSSEYAATWNCAVDASINHSQADRSTAAGTAWSMDASSPTARPWAQTASATAIITSNQTGVVSFDVTADVAAMLSGSWAGYGFLIRKQDESQSGQVDFVARQRGPAPRLRLTVEVPPGGGNSGSGALDAGHDAGGQTCRFLASADSHIRQGEPNRNFGADLLLGLQASGRNRALVNFEIAPIAATVGSAHLDAAYLELTIAQT